MFRRLRERLGLVPVRPRGVTLEYGPRDTEPSISTQALLDRALELARRPVGVSVRELADDTGVTRTRAGVVLDGYAQCRLATVHMGRWYAGEPIELEGTGE